MVNFSASFCLPPHSLLQCVVWQVHSSVSELQLPDRLRYRGFNVELTPRVPAKTILHSAQNPRSAPFEPMLRNIFFGFPRASGPFKPPKRPYSRANVIDRFKYTDSTVPPAASIDHSPPVSVLETPSAQYVLETKNSLPLLSVAPMMEYTDQNFRFFMRLLSKHSWLYTEMVVDQTVVHNRGRLGRWLDYHPTEHPVVVQLGGSDPDVLSAAAAAAAEYGYDEINLNCGCPSDKVAGRGCFGASLMLDPHRVARAVAGMARATGGAVPITVKCRIGVDDHDSYDELCHFIRVVSDAGVAHFIVHARKALLNGLSPKQNRTVPPLRYEVVYDLVRDFPHLRFTLNGGVKTLDDVEEHLRCGVHGVMIGRAANDDPFNVFADADRRVFGMSNVGLSRRAVLEQYAAFAEEQKQTSRQSMFCFVKPILNLFHNEPAGRLYRRAIDDAIKAGCSLPQIIESAVAVVPSDSLERTVP